MSAKKLNAIKSNGEEFQLLAPFFEMLLPAFEKKSVEIQVEMAFPKLKITCDGNSSFVPLPDSPHGYGPIAFSRILILAEMNIALEGEEQNGQFKVKLDQQIIPINVVSRRNNAQWFLKFRPEWNKTKSAN